MAVILRHPLGGQSNRLPIVAFEGIDGAGKSTACLKLSRMLNARRVSSEVLSAPCFVFDQLAAPNSVRAVREAERLGPIALCLSNAAEFATSWESVAVPAQSAGRLILGDRFVHSALVRDVVRGVDESYVRHVYSFVPAPDLVVFIDVEPDVAFRRIERSREVGYYEAGCDVIRNALEPRLAFLAFQTACRNRYHEVLPEDRTAVVDGGRSPDQVLQQIIEAMKEHLPDVVPADLELALGQDDQDDDEDEDEFDDDDDDDVVSSEPDRNDEFAEDPDRGAERVNDD